MLGEIQVGILGLGLCLLGTVYFFLGIFSKIYVTSLVLAFIAWLAVVAVIHVRSQERRNGPVQRPARSTLLPVLFSFLCLFIFLLGYLPPTAKDALIQHLALPRLFLKEHVLVTLPTASFSWYPMTIDLLFLLPMSLGSDTIPTLIHALFGLLTARLLYLYLQKKVGLGWAWFGVFLFLTVPVIVFLSTVAYVDLALVFYSLMALIGLIHWRDSIRGGGDEGRWFVLSALSVGAAMATKYNGYILFLFAAAASGWIAVRSHQKSMGQTIKRVFFFSVLAILVASPWLLRNMLEQGNPLFPLLGNLFGGSSAEGTLSPLRARRVFYGESWLQIAALPVRMFFVGEDGDAARFDGRLNPMLLLLPLLTLSIFLGRTERQKNEKNDILFFAAFVVTYMCYALVMGGARVRYLAPVVPPLVILGVIGLARFQETVHFPKICRMIAVVALLLNGPYLLSYTQRLDPWNYWMGREGREAYLSKHLIDYPVLRYLNDQTPKKAKVLLIFTGNRGYYCDRDYLYDSPLDGETLTRIAETSGSAGDIEAGLRKLGVTHIMMNRLLLVRSFSKTLQAEKWKLFQEFARTRLKPLYGNDPFYLYEI